MYVRACLVFLGIVSLVVGAEVESRRLTHYVPQDFLETAVRTENWTEIPLQVKGGILKGDTVRIWAGGSIDRGGDQPSQNVTSPTGGGPAPATSLALSPDSSHAYALLFKNETAGIRKSLPAGQPLEIKMA